MKFAILRNRAKKFVTGRRARTMWILCPESCFTATEIPVAFPFAPPVYFCGKKCSTYYNVESRIRTYVKVKMACMCVLKDVYHTNPKLPSIRFSVIFLYLFDIRKAHASRGNSNISGVPSARGNVRRKKQKSHRYR